MEFAKHQFMDLTLLPYVYNEDMNDYVPYGAPIKTGEKYWKVYIDSTKEGKLKLDQLYDKYGNPNSSSPGADHNGIYIFIKYIK